MYDYLVVGAGFSGSVIARELADKGFSVILIDERDHIGGNAYDYLNSNGLYVQKYGPHIFHTKIKRVWNYLSKFTEWNNYVHRVLVNLGDKSVYLPINLDTMEKLYERKFTSDEMKRFLNRRKIDVDVLRNSKDVIISQVGNELYEIFFKNYTKKQWGVYPEDLDASVLKRIPLRFNRDTRYFEDTYQGIPERGFTELIKNILNNKNIDIKLKTKYREIKDRIRYRKIIFTGPIDGFFNYKLGKLPYRSLEFEFKTFEREYYQSEGVVNYPNDNEFTRITEFKHFYHQKSKKTVICYEYPQSEGNPFYPIPRKDNYELYLKYEKLAEKEKNLFFLGRLGEYKYINMDIAVNNALKLSDEIEG